MQVEEVPFAELLSDIVDNRGKTCPTADIGTPLIATNCIRNDLLYPAYEKIRYVSQETYDTWFRGHPKPGDLIFVNKGTPGRVCIAPDPVDFCIAQDMVAVRADPKKIYPKYLFALLRSPMIQIRIEQMHVGTLIPHFKKGDFDKLLLPILDRDAQRFIGDTYFELSAKIELNRRMNETLEGMARAIFRSWFVDFEPVRARAQRKDAEAQRRKEKQGQDSFASLRLGGSALNPAIADLFPDAFEASELGEIPREWEIWRVADVGEVVCGKTPSTKIPEYYGNDVPFIRIPDMHGKIFATKTQKMLSLAGAASQEKTTLPAGSICVSCIGTVGLVIITTQESQTNQQINSVIPKSPNETYFWYWVFFDLRDKIKARGSGGSVLTNLSKGRFSQLKIQSPPASLRSSYNTLVGPLFERILLNDKESGILAALRDTLLPKLISGELRVPDAERIVGRCV